jgi:hypothetical protein
MTADLVQFLRDRYDEDEEVAHAATWDDHSAVWTARPPQDTYERYTVVDYCDDGVAVVIPENADADSVGHHIARHDPAHVLRGIEADRQLLRDYEGAVRTLAVAGQSGTVYDLMTGAVNTLARQLRLRALPYSDHPDYREEWRP